MIVHQEQADFVWIDWNGHLEFQVNGASGARLSDSAQALDVIHIASAESGEIQPARIRTGGRINYGFSKRVIWRESGGNMPYPGVLCVSTLPKRYKHVT